MKAWFVPACWSASKEPAHSVGKAAGLVALGLVAPAVAEPWFLN